MSVSDELFMPFFISSRGEAIDLEIMKSNRYTILHEASGLNSRELIIAILTKYPAHYEELGGHKLIHSTEQSFGNNPLMHAISNSNIEEALILLDENVVTDESDMLEQINGLDDNKKTPLMLAIAKGASHQDDLFGGPCQSLVIDRLLELSAEVNIQNIDGQTALHYAAAHRDLDLMVKLINAGARLDLSDKYGNAPLDMMLCTREQANAFLYKSARVFTLEDTRWANDAAFLEEFTQREMIHPPWKITPKAPNITAQPFKPKSEDPAAKEREKAILTNKKEIALARALDEFHDYVPESDSGLKM